MPGHSTRFDAAAGDLVLSGAILLYRAGSASQAASAFASIHSVELDDDGQPTIAAGVPLSRAHLRQWTEALGRTTRPELLPPDVLVAHADMLAWWTPAQVRPAYFALSNPPPDLRALSDRTIAPVPYPAHLFVATRSGLGVYALPTDARPMADTELRHSPVLNVYANGQLCWGNIARPGGLDLASIPAFERAVFDSWSTHLNPGQERTVTGRGGLVRLWDDLAARRAKRFPVGRLRPFTTGAGQRGGQTPGGGAEPMTLGTLVARGRR
ncbi:PRTRC system protein B [Sphingomonas sp. 2R-10]|uniref:PRTRC system protein B n=1 Tax=Sphingomonas sp. 2R-10 TaxID=3045148 RepID=UPI000F774EC5|nr:PRTRC system protein B [Sphingomonas sp. 2R-10]MDJ0276304.1 PRTRC system protein B [Sphingomonas sp. 2R-10]